MRSVVAVFHHAMFAYDVCTITTRCLRAADDLVFMHTIGYPDSGDVCVTAWETLQSGVD